MVDDQIIKQRPLLALHVVMLLPQQLEISIQKYISPYGTIKTESNAYVRV